MGQKVINTLSKPNRFIFLIFLQLLLLNNSLFAYRLLVPMDSTQTDHLKAYGLAFWSIKELGNNVEWLLNYKGGSFLLEDDSRIYRKAELMGIYAKRVSVDTVQRIFQKIEENNMERVLLNKAPRIAVYTPKGKEPWDDAVTLALTYAEINYEKIYDAEILTGKLNDYDWLHLHHEDFTGQFGKFWASYRNYDWYRNSVTRATIAAKKSGFKTVAAHKLRVAKIIKSYVSKGGLLFAMCSACDSIDVALAADGYDIIPQEIDGTPIEPNVGSKLKFDKTFSFKDFPLIFSPGIYEYSGIDYSNYGSGRPSNFRLFEFSAKFDIIPTLLTQNHTAIIPGFFGQTTSFKKKFLKEKIVILGENNKEMTAKYIYGTLGKGFFTFYAGHDPADPSHVVGEGPTNLALHKNSPGYRLILNNVLFPAAKKKERKT
ncbi:asparagine synthetase B [Candidatus Riflebacteria bacterium]